MFACGESIFEMWAKQTPAPNGLVFYNTCLGPFNPEMSAEEANKRLDHVGKITTEGQEAFIRGWEKARKTYKEKNP